MVIVKNIVGIDVSKLNIDVYDGQKSYPFKNNVTGFKHLVKQPSGTSVNGKGKIY
jgi:transposase